MRRTSAWYAEPNLLSRASRFPIRASLRYRLPSEVIWREATTENVSSSGVLFRVEGLEEWEELKTPFDVSFVLPQEIGGDGATEIFCSAYPVRAALPRAEHGSHTLGARIADYRLIEEPDNPPQPPQVDSRSPQSTDSALPVALCKAA